MAADATSTTRTTEPEALANVRTVLQLCAAGKPRCSAKTQRPSTATAQVVAGSQATGDFYPDDAITAFAWPQLVLQVGGSPGAVPGRRAHHCR